MFETLNLADASAVARLVWGAVVTLLRVSFQCGCTVEGYQDCDLLLVTGGRPCYKHAPDGSQAVVPCFDHPEPVRQDWESRAWGEGHRTGYLQGHATGSETGRTEGYSNGFRSGVRATLADVLVAC